MAEQRNNSIDLVKYIAALLIVALHTNLFSEVNSNLNFVVVHVICRLAVPFFAVCTGFFSAKKCGSFFDRRDKMSFPWNNLARQWKRLVLLYLVWTCIYLLYSIPKWINTGWFSFWAFVDYGVGAVTIGSHYHLWYLLGLLYSLPLFYLCLRYLPVSGWFVSAIVLYMVKAIGYGYANLLSWKAICELSECRIIRDVLIVLPFLLLGAVISRKKEYDLQTSVLWFGVSFLLLFIEASLLRHWGQNRFSYLFFTFPTAYWFFQVVLQLRGCKDHSICNLLGKMSLYVYCIHPVFLEILHNRISDTLAVFLCTVFLSSVSSLLIVFISSNRRLILKQRI